MNRSLILPECVPPDEMALYHLGDLPPDRCLEIDHHIYSCPFCQGLANELADTVQRELEARLNVLPAPERTGPLRFLADAARVLPRLVSSIKPAEALQPGFVFAPDTTETVRSRRICHVNDELRWSAPIELGVQYIYVEATGPTSMLVTVAGSRLGKSPEEAISTRVDTLQVPVRGTKFDWRVSHSFGPVEELIDRYGKDYEITLVVSPFQSSSE